MPAWSAFQAAAAGEAPPPELPPPFESAVRARLLADYGFRDEHTLHHGRCPSCDRKSLVSTGLHLACTRIAKCGYETTVPDLYPDLYADFSTRFGSAADADPDATAAAWIRHRWGLDPERFEGWSCQSSYYHPRAGGSSTVRFTIAPGITWDALTDPVTVRRDDGTETIIRERLNGRLDGQWWAPPGMDLAKPEFLWIVASIPEALALAAAGVPAVALVKSDEYPEAGLRSVLAACMSGGRPELVWAFEGYHSRKWVERAAAEGWPCRAAMPTERPAGRTWVDMHLRGRLSAQHREQYLYFGALALAKSPTDKALLIFRQGRRQSFHLEHSSALWWWELNQKDYEKALKDADIENPADATDEAIESAARTAGSLTKLSNCLPEPLYYQRHEFLDEHGYYFRVSFPHEGPAMKTTFSAAQLAAAPEFGKRLLSLPGAVWRGTAKHQSHLLEHWLYGIKQVRTIDYQGYAKDHAAYVWGSLAVQSGRVYPLNEEDFFDLPRVAIKSLLKTPSLELNPNLAAFTPDWEATLYTAFGSQGLVCLAFWLGALFAEQIRARQKSYPFLEVVGLAGSGKSTLIQFLWKLVGNVGAEGFDASTASTAAIARELAQVSNLPIVLLEGDRTAANNTQGRPVKGFDYQELKKCYNGNPYRARGVKNAGNETYAPPFRGAIVIEQNLDVVGDDATLQRLIHVAFTDAGHTAASQKAAERLEQWPVEQLSGFLLRATMAERDILARYFERCALHEAALSADPLIRKFRIVRNHAQMRALVDCLPLVLPVPLEHLEATHGALIDMAAERQRAIASDHPLVEEFWDLYDWIEEGALNLATILNHSKDPALIAINLPHFAEIAGARKGSCPPVSELKRVLKTSKSRKFLDWKAVDSAISNRTVKCWIFEARK